MISKDVAQQRGLRKSGDNTIPVRVVSSGRYESGSNAVTTADTRKCVSAAQPKLSPILAADPI